jgi:hypothetical protein
MVRRAGSQADSLSKLLKEFSSQCSLAFGTAPGFDGTAFYYHILFSILWYNYRHAF